MTALDGAGTPEDAWLDLLRRLDLPPLRLDPPRRALVVAPHPDDEVLAVGGLLALLAAAGTSVSVLAVTDGEASNPGGSVPPDELATLRVAETDEALRRLGVRADVHRLGLPDGGREALLRPVAEAVSVDVGDWLLAPWAGDGHPDHEAVGRACEQAAARNGARLLAYPVWAWHGDPSTSRMPWDRARRVDLPEQVQAAKAAAVQAFVSQVRPLGPLPADAPVLPPHVLARFARPFEVVFG